jgi:hypothetical protein
MTEKLTSTTVETPAETPVVDPEAIDEGDIASAETSGEVESSTVQRLEEARQHLSDLLDAREASDEEEPAPETDEKSEDTPEKKEKRNKNFLKKIGGWAVKSLEANGFLPLPSRAGFVAKSRLWHQRRKSAQSVAGFLSPEANSQLNGGGETSPDTTAEDEKSQSRLRRIQRRMGRSTLVALAKPKTWKEIRNIK